MEGDYITRPEHEAFSETMRAENKRMEDENNRQNKRLDIIEHSMREFQRVQTSMEKMETIMESTLKEIEKQGKRIENLESRDGEMWRKVIGYTATAIVGIAIGVVSRQLGM